MAVKMEEKNYINENSMIIGNVSLGSYISLWPNSVLRGDLSTIFVGNYTNIQDNCVVHCEKEFPVTIGSFVTVGHGAVVHGTVIEDFCVIGLKSIVLNGSRIGRGSVVAAGAVVKEKLTVPPFSLVVGNPAVVKENRYSDFTTHIDNALIYYYLSRCYMRKQLPDEKEVEMIYEAAREGAIKISEAILRGDNPGDIYSKPIPLPF